MTQSPYKRLYHKSCLNEKGNNYAFLTDSLIAFTQSHTGGAEEERTKNAPGGSTDQCHLSSG